MPCRPCSFVNNVLKKKDDTLKYSVLGLGYAPNEYDVERTEWMKHGIVFDFAESIDEAADKLLFVYGEKCYCTLFP